jgi:hypothetical protein
LDARAHTFQNGRKPDILAYFHWIYSLTRIGRPRRPANFSEVNICSSSSITLILYSLSISHPVLYAAPGCLRTADSTNLQATESLLCPIWRLTTNTVSLANDVSQKALGPPSEGFVPRTSNPSSLARQSPIAPRIPVHLCVEVRLLSDSSQGLFRHQGQLIPLLTLARAN